MEIKLKKRNEIPAEYKWHIHNLCPSDEIWKQEIAAMPDKIARIASFEGKLSQGESLLACLEAWVGTGDVLGRLYVYATMKKHEDTTIPLYQGMADTAQSMYIKFDAAAAFIEPEILSAGEEHIRQCLSTIPGMKLYAHYLNNLLRQKNHVLSAEIEVILANAAEIGSAPKNVYDMIHDADMKFGSVTDADGNTQELTHGRFIRLLESRDRQVRKNTFETYYESYWKQKNTLASLYNASVKKDCFFASTRKYPSALDAALSAYNIPRAVYEKLIETVHEFLPEMHRYVRLRKKALKVSELHMYDVYTSIVHQQDEAMPYDKAKDILLKSLAPLGEEYSSLCKNGMDNGWIDLYENEGKCSGAYSWGVRGCHPFVLMNYENKMDDLFTLAHEMGHAMHSHYSWTNQPAVYADYTIFLAEVASTVNEALLMEYLLANTQEKSMRAYLINHYLEQFRGTVFRQTMFAEFEKRTHEENEKDEPLTIESINRLYRDLNALYYGKDMVLDEQIDLEWSRIPHFYNAFYVYQYATGYSAAIAFSQRLLQKDAAKRQKAVEDYIGFLKSGSSDYSINILQKAGVNMSRPEPVREALAVFKNLVTELEGLIG